MPPLPPYAKPALPPAALLAHLQARGLIVPDPLQALAALEYIGYYRLLIYMRPLQNLPGKAFAAGTTFQHVVDLYNFDRELRLLSLDAIERIEVALRAAIVAKVADGHGAHFYLDRIHFESHSGYLEFLNAAARAKYLGIDHYRARYGFPELAPMWTIMEAVTYGTLSRLYSALVLPHRKAIALRFGLDETVLVSWFRSLNVLRNMCAHHNRLWDFIMKVDQPKAAKRYQAELTPGDQFYARAVVLGALMDVVEPGHSWKARLVGLTDRYPRVPTSRMGFPLAWRTRAFWN